MDDHLTPIQPTTTTHTPAGLRPLGLVALFSGAALLATILFDVSLRISLLITTAVLVGVVAFVVGGAPPADRARIGRLVAGGLVMGIVATATYDVVKLVLAAFDPSPFNPFEAIRHFGASLVGEGAAPALIQTAGWAYHLVNGMAFAISYLLLLGDRRTVGGALLAGVLWGIGLETFQLTLYPGWLSVGFLAEFQRISFASHLVYGALLGVGGRLLHRRKIAPS